MPVYAKDTENAPRGRRRSSVVGTVVLVGLLCCGVAIMAYPTVSDWWNSFHTTRAIASYNEAIAQMDEVDLEAMRAEAVAFNEHLAALAAPFSEFDKVRDEYERALNVGGDGLMGYVSIPKINVQLPIYHGTSEGVLNGNVGHLEGSSLPVGGPGTHAVLCAHRGLPEATLFTDMDRLKEGDTFSVTVLDRELFYEVDQILIVEPDHMDALAIVEGEDLCTLQTCTPYGVNSHRMLVRGHRIDEPLGASAAGDVASRVSPAMAAAAVGVPALTVTLALALVLYRRKPPMPTVGQMADWAARREDVKGNKEEKSIASPKEDS